MALTDLTTWHAAATRLGIRYPYGSTTYCALGNYGTFHNRRPMQDSPSREWNTSSRRATATSCYRRLEPDLPPVSEEEQQK
jgi:hypothetical protein